MGFLPASREVSILSDLKLQSHFHMRLNVLTRRPESVEELCSAMPGGV